MREFTILFWACFCFTLFAGCETKLNKEQVPIGIRTQVTNKYNPTSEINWTREVKSYQASFILNDRYMSVSFDKNGNLIEELIEIKESEVPLLVIKSANKIKRQGQFQRFFKDIWKNKLLYLIEIKIEQKIYNVYFSPEGRFIKKAIKLN